ncbi:MAG TPA: anti-sigma factor antagonist [Gammaproteobacteria bacterium]|jgi:anti-sigma B factor antagonist|nr:anti-sigma factor antagonist [Gammaproteobacteria bacterium]
MQLERQDFGEAIMITVDEARIDAAIAIQFKDSVREMAGDAPARVILDMTKVEFLDSSGLGAVVAVMKQLGGDRALELAGLTPTVEKVFQLTRMDSVFAIHKDTSAAVSGLAHAS